MTESDKKDIAEIVTAAVVASKTVEGNNSNHPNMKSLIDGVLKILTVLTSTGVLWMATNIVGLREQVLVLKTKFEEVEKFTSSPRFTGADFNQQVQPLKQEVEENSETLSKRESWMKTQEIMNTDFKLAIQRLQNDIKELQGQ